MNLIDGEEFSRGCRDVCTVDGVRPNGIGFDRMRALVAPTPRSISG